MLCSCMPWSLLLQQCCAYHKIIFVIVVCYSLLFPVFVIGNKNSFTCFRYCDPSRTFPSQSEVISFAVSLVQKYVMENPKTLIVCGTYTIGKEKIFTGEWTTILTKTVWVVSLIIQVFLNFVKAAITYSLFIVKSVLTFFHKRMNPSLSH